MWYWELMPSLKSFNEINMCCLMHCFNYMILTWETAVDSTSAYLRGHRSDEDVNQNPCSSHLERKQSPIRRRLQTRMNKFKCIITLWKSNQHFNCALWCHNIMAIHTVKFQRHLKNKCHLKTWWWKYKRTVTTE